MYPEELRYLDTHEWVKVDDKTAIIGITHYAQDQLGDLVYVELPEVGTDLKAKDPYGSVESVKAVSDVHSPVSGKVIEINEALQDTPEQVNQDCYGQGWMIKVEMSDPAEVESLLTAQDYQKLLT